MIPVGLFLFTLFTSLALMLYQQYHLMKRGNIIDNVGKKRESHYSDVYMLAMVYAKYLTRATIRAREYDKLIETLTERGKIKGFHVPGLLLTKEEALEWAHTEKIFSKDWANTPIQVPVFKTMLKDHAQLRAHYEEIYGKNNTTETAKKT